MPDASDLLRSLCFPCYGHHRDLHSFPTRRSSDLIVLGEAAERALAVRLLEFGTVVASVGAELEPHRLCGFLFDLAQDRSEEHTSELQSRRDLVCRLLLEKKKNKRNTNLECDQNTN